MVGFNTDGHFCQYYYFYWMKNVTLQASHFAVFKETNNTIKHLRNEFNTRQKQNCNTTLLRIHLNFGTILKEGNEDREKQYIWTPDSNSTMDKTAYAYLEASKFVLSTKCCLGEQIEAHDAGAKLEVNIKTSVAKFGGKTAPETQIRRWEKTY
jgi:hypothetical protein